MDDMTHAIFDKPTYLLSKLSRTPLIGDLKQIFLALSSVVVKFPVAIEGEEESLFD